jgi:dipeptidyl aminopeptidase/acylaminoacyl peptidase
VLRLKYWRIIVIAVLITGIFLVMVAVKALSPGESAIFIQKNGLQKTLYVVNEDGSGLKALNSGKEINTYTAGEHLLIYCDRQLYEYNREKSEPQLITSFGKDVDFCYAFAMKPAGPDQALVVTGSQYSSFLRWYVLEFSDGSLRKIKPPYDSIPSGTSSESSPDESAEVTIKSTSFGTRYEVQIKSTTAGGAKDKNIWILPKEMTTLPVFPVWSPNSRMLAFYAKQLNDKEGLNGSYSLYVFDLDRKELILVQSRVFSIENYNKLEMGEFRPSWSGDSKYLIVEYQPFGLPTESSVLRYETSTGTKIFLNNSPGEKQYPAWSPSGNRILYLSSVEGKGYQLYAMDASGGKAIRLSPPSGITEWAKWLRF